MKQSDNKNLTGLQDNTGLNKQVEQTTNSVHSEMASRGAKKVQMTREDIEVRKDKLDKLRESEGLDTIEALYLLKGIYKNSKTAKSIFSHLGGVFFIVAFCFLDWLVFHTLDVKVEVPSSTVELRRWYITDTTDEDNVHGLAVRVVSVKSVFAYPFILINYWDDREHIDWFKSEEFFPMRGDKRVETKPDIELGSDSFDMTLSAYIAVNNYIKGGSVPYSQVMKVRSVNLPLDYKGGDAVDIYPEDTLVSIGDIQIKDELDYKMAKVFYRTDVVKVKVRRGTSELVFESTVPSINLYRSTLMHDKEDYKKYTDFANLANSKTRGKSAGAGIALSYYNTNIENVTKDRNVAISGVLLADGTLKPIGGVDLKTLAAENLGVDILFFVNDYSLYSGSELKIEVANYKDGKRMLQELDSEIEIVGVSTFEEIINYLKATK